MSDISTETGQQPQATSTFGTGFAVAFLYVFFVVAVFAGFASYLTRNELQGQMLIATGSAEGLDDVIYLLRREETLQANIETALNEVAETAELIDGIERSLKGLEDHRQGKVDELARHTANVLDQSFVWVIHWDDASREEALKIVDSDDPPETRMRRLLDRAPAYLPLAGVSTRALEQMRRDLESAKGTLASLDTALDEVRARELDFQADLERAVGVQAWPHKQKAQFEAELDALRLRLPANSSERARLSALSSALFGGLFLKLVSFPTIFLTLIVTMAAGGLGTVVSYTRNMQRREQEYPPGAPEREPPTLSRLMVYVGEGIAAAMAIFLLAGAGMLVLTQGSGASDQIELSPYTVAFIAFLSGFMAEHAFTRIQEAGKQIFKVEEKEKKPEEESTAAKADEDTSQQRGGNGGAALAEVL